MRRRLLSALMFVAVLRIAPSHREILNGVRHLLRLVLPLLVLLVAPVAAADNHLTPAQRQHLIEQARKLEGVELLPAHDASPASKEGLNDYGCFLVPGMFRSVSTITDRVGGTGSPTFELRTNGQVSAEEVQRIFETTVEHATGFLQRYGIDVTKDGLPPLSLKLMILTISDLNSAEHFSQTSPICMSCPGDLSDDRCAECFLGRTFYAPESPRVNVYVAFSRIRGRYGWRQSLAHELLHFLIFHAGAKPRVSERREHHIIKAFLSRYGHEIETGHALEVQARR